MNRSYEIMFIVRPDVEEAELDTLIDTFSGYITDGGGVVKNSRTDQKMGRRRLAYTVGKYNDGFYVLLVVDAPAALIAEIERRLRVSENVIKFITVRMDEEDKRVAKIKAHRDSHVKRSAIPVQPAHPFPSAPTATETTEPTATETAETPAAIATEAAAPVEAPVAETPAVEAPAATEPVTA